MADLKLEDVDLTSVSAEHPVSLTSCADDGVDIRNIHGCSLVRVMESLKGDNKETEALVELFHERLKHCTWHSDSDPGLPT